MKLSNFVSKEPRALPVFILADTSGSMMGAKINELNLALRQMVSEFQNVDEIRGKFQLSIITFGPIVQVIQPLADIEGIQLKELTAGGRTPMGAAFETVSAMIEDKLVVSLAHTRRLSFLLATESQQTAPQSIIHLVITVSGTP